MNRLFDYPASGVADHQLHAAEATAHEELLGAVRGQRGAKHRVGLRRLAVAAGVEVDRRVALLRPGVDGEVGLLDHDDTAHTVRLEGMEPGSHDAGARLDGGARHQGLDGVEVVEHLGIASPVFDQKMSPQRVQRSSLREKRLSEKGNGPISTPVLRQQTKFRARFISAACEARRRDGSPRR